MVTKVTVTYEIITDDSQRTAGDVAQLIRLAVHQSAADDALLTALTTGEAEQIPADRFWATQRMTFITVQAHSHKEATAHDD